LSDVHRGGPEVNRRVNARQKEGSMTSLQTDYQAIEYWYTFDQPITLFARSGVPGLFPDQRTPHANLADGALPENPYGRRVNDIGQEFRRCVEFA
jgi:hypothetical protein